MLNSLKAPADLIGRDEEWRLMCLGYVAEKNLLFISVPGTVKTMQTRIFAECIGKSFFGLQMSHFTTPEAWMGEVDVKKLRETGMKYVVIDGMLPDSEIGLLDEIFKTGPPSRDPQLTFLAEGVYRSGGRYHKAKTRFVVAASNEMPEGKDADGSAAFLDRFVLKHEMKPVKRHARKLIRKSVRDREIRGGGYLIDKLDLDDASKARPHVKVTAECDEMIDEILCRLEDDHGIIVTDRTGGYCDTLIRAHAAIEGRMETKKADLEVLQYALWHDRKQISTVRDVVAHTINPLQAELNKIVQSAIAISEEVKRESPTDPSEKLKVYMTVNTKLKDMKQRVRQLGDPAADPFVAEAIQNLDEVQESYLAYIDKAIKG